MDLIIRNGNLPDGSKGIDIGIKNKKIVAIQESINEKFLKEIDASGKLVSPPFIDSHFHMDSTLSLGQPRLNQSGTLLEGIALWGELKPDLTFETIKDRALKYCDLAVARGLLGIRSHVDICDPRLLAVDALLQVKKEVSSYLDLQLVAFPQDGYFRCPGTIKLLETALDRGVDVVGGIPHFERTMEEGKKSVEALCRIAAQRGLRVDMHCDESDDPMSRHIETLTFETIRHGLKGLVTGSHLTSMHSMDNYYVSKLLPLMLEAEVSVVSNPLINITLQGRHDTYPKRRGLTRVKEMISTGISVAFGQDCVMDPWYSLGSADMLEVASMGLHVAQLTGVEEIKECFRSITEVPATIMGLEGYGLKKGCNADLVILQAADPIEAIRLKANRLYVIRQGEVISCSSPQEAKLNLPGRPKIQNFMFQ